MPSKKPSLTCSRFRSLVNAIRRAPLLPQLNALHVNAGTISARHGENTITSNKHSLNYLRFLYLVHAIRQAPLLPQLDALEERLLNVFAAAWHAGTPIPVTEAYLLVPDASERTVSGRLKTLCEKDLLMFGKDDHDQRVRYVLPTERTNRYFSHLGRCMEQAQDR